MMASTHMELGPDLSYLHTGQNESTSQSETIMMTQLNVNMQVTRFSNLDGSIHNIHSVS